ncbi:hypothetical protein Sste5346_008039 [Sporothrix stenoceras]|uniref:Uncharacterized protein n=1 Tax=Sporothrix stenoceras TaxID=5173 RepID=A0ABR3YS89_9PEZI
MSNPGDTSENSAAAPAKTAASQRCTPVSPYSYPRNSGASDIPPPRDFYGVSSMEISALLADIRTTTGSANDIMRKSDTCDKRARHGILKIMPDMLYCVGMAVVNNPARVERREMAIIMLNVIHQADKTSYEHVVKVVGDRDVQGFFENDEEFKTVLAYFEALRVKAVANLSQWIRLAINNDSASVYVSYLEKQEKESKDKTRVNPDGDFPDSDFAEALASCVQGHEFRGKGVSDVLMENNFKLLHSLVKSLTTIDAGNAGNMRLLQTYVEYAENVVKILLQDDDEVDEEYDKELAMEKEKKENEKKVKEKEKEKMEKEREEPKAKYFVTASGKTCRETTYTEYEADQARLRDMPSKCTCNTSTNNGILDDNDDFKDLEPATTMISSNLVDNPN